MKMEQIENYLNKIICGDCLETMKKMPSNSIDLVVTSPPYNLKNSTGNGMKDGRGGKWAGAALVNGYSHHDDNMPHDKYVKWQRDCLAEKALELWGKVKSNLWCDSSAALKAEAVGLCAKKLFSENLVSASTIEVVDLTDDAFAAKYGDVAWCKAAIEALRSYNKTLEESVSKSESIGTNIPLDGSMNLVVDEDKKATYRSTKVKQQPPMRSEDNK